MNGETMFPKELMAINISLIIVNYNTEPFLKACLDSLESPDLSPELEIIVFDNHSQDNSRAMIKNHYPKVILIESSENLGFAEANNRAAKLAQGKYLFFLNPDTKLAKNCLHKLMLETTNQASEDFILIPRQVTYDFGAFISQGLAVDIFGYPNNAYTNDGNRQIRPIFYADGAALFMPKATFFQLGMFDPDYFMYQEDIDLSWRAHLLNVKLVPVPEAVVFHKVGAVAGGGLTKGRSYATSLTRRYLAEKNLQTNLLKNYAWPNLLWVLPAYWFLSICEIFLFLILVKPLTSASYLRAYWWNINHLPQTLRKRKEIQKRRLVTDKKLLAQMVKIPSKFFLLFRAGIPKVNH